MSARRVVAMAAIVGLRPTRRVERPADENTSPLPPFPAFLRLDQRGSRWVYQHGTAPPRATHLRLPIVEHAHRHRLAQPWWSLRAPSGPRMTHSNGRSAAFGWPTSRVRRGRALLSRRKDLGEPLLPQRVCTGGVACPGPSVIRVVGGPRDTPALVAPASDRRPRHTRTTRLRVEHLPGSPVEA